MRKVEQEINGVKKVYAMKKIQKRKDMTEIDYQHIKNECKLLISVKHPSPARQLAGDFMPAISYFPLDFYAIVCYTIAETN